MFALSTLIEAVPAPVPSFALWLHPTPFAWAGLIALAFALSLTFRKAEAHARVHARGHVSIQATAQSTAD